MYALQAFSQLRQRVIWRYRGEIENVTSRHTNIRLIRWLPQASLLANPKTRLFISHCGINSFFEAAYFGVPVLAVPLWGDQINNAVRLTDYLYMGLRVDIFTMTAQSLYSDIQRVLTNESYRNARQVAALSHDQPMSAAERILFWINYIMRHNGVPHLRSAAVDMPVYQYLSLDVIAVLSLCFILLGLILLYFVSCLVRLVRFSYLKIVYQIKKI